ncbi:MAG TPA: magnesium transporter CorA family protein [Polyangiaceae bacterium]|nr:magnesium transporter CorA family protein [Polyangiaceae bacterium]
MLRSLPDAREPWTDATWLDLCNASDDERAAVERAMGLRVPDQSAVSEIETSSRVYTEKDALYLSTPIPASPNASQSLSAVGFVLSRRVLISVRFADNPVFDGLFQSCQGAPAHSPCDVFLRILEALVDRAADTLEHCSAELDGLSQRAFHAERVRRHAVKTVSEKLRATLRKLGQIGDHISQIRDTLLGFGRIAAFVCETGGALVGADERPRLLAIRADIGSLNDYQQHLSGKVQFLLDATLGFISIEQNDVVKALTIVSVVGVPPVLVAGVYGMNFVHMPELHWVFGYPFALGLMLLTGLLPLVWFKWRGWM